MKLKIAVLVLFVWGVGGISAQSSGKKLRFEARYGGKGLVLNEYYQLNPNDSIQITAFRFYISNLALLNHGETVWKETDSFHLINVEEANSLLFAEIPGALVYDQVSFDLGIDSATNVSGVMGGALDPMFGMYWSWQSGYINLKLEGNSNVCPTRNHAFEFHLGGYSGSDDALQHIVLDVSGQDVLLVADVGQWLRNIDLAEENQVMSPGEKTVRLMRMVGGVFNIE